MKRITINNEVFILEKDVTAEMKRKNVKPSVRQIVVLNRGWVVVGNYYEKGNDCTLTDASVIRKWGTTKGLGELAERGVLPDTVLDACPNVHFHKSTMVARMDVNSENWK
jgi:hypothetical protein